MMAWIMVRDRLINLDHVVEVAWERNGESYRIRAWDITREKVLDEYIAKERMTKVIQVLVYATKAIPLNLQSLDNEEVK